MKIISFFSKSCINFCTTKSVKCNLTKFLKENKPKGSPIPKNWFEKCGTLEIETLDDGSQIWKYTSAKGDTVPYINQQVKFPKVSEYKVVCL